LALPRFSRDENAAANSSPLHVAKSNTETARRVLRPTSPTPVLPPELNLAFGAGLSQQSGHWRSRQRSTSSITIRAPVAIVAQRPEILAADPGVPPISLAETRLCPPYKSL